MLFHFAACPYCAQARRALQNLLEDHPEYQQLDIELIDEKLEPARAARYDYWYVPTFYIGRRKVHEGPINARGIEEILKKAMAEGE
mgnify:CR=1 FL=1